MALATRTSAFATRVAQEAKALRTLINGNATDLSALTTTTKMNLVAAINELVSGKAPTSHTHTKSQISDFSHTHTKAEISDFAHTHHVNDLTATGTKSSSTFLRGDNTWATPPNTTYSTMSQAEAESDTSTTARLATGQRLFQAISKWAVTLAGTQTVTGAKTFSIPPSIAALGNSAPATDAGNGSIWYDEDEPGVTTQTDAAALTTGTLGIARLPTTVVHRVIYSGGAWPARPSGATCVEWVGPVAPTMTSSDTFVDTSA